MALGEFKLSEGVHFFDQTQAEMVSALRRERKGYFVVLSPDDPVYGFYVNGTAVEIVVFLKTVIASAEAELKLVLDSLPAEVFEDLASDDDAIG